MPYCEISKHQNTTDDDAASKLSGDNIKIFYTTCGHGPTKILLIIGLAGTHDSWGPQIKGLIGTDVPEDSGFQICSFDNRGMGCSSIPTNKSDYTTTIMARDALALMDHLGWPKAHLFGHSMGAMIASKFAAIAPHRILSLALLNVTAGGFQCLPKIDKQMLSLAIRFLKAKTPEQRAAVDLDTHYTKEYLDEYVGPHTRRTILYQEYVKNISSSGMQSNHGFDGQINACWTHKLTSKEVEVIRSAGFLVSVIHGRYDIIAQICHARKLAKKLHPMARMVDLHGGHLVSHERPEEVNKALLELIEASESKFNPQDWSKLPCNETGSEITGMQKLSIKTEKGYSSSLMVDILRKVHLCLMYIFGLLVLAFQHGWKFFKHLKPVRVGPSAR